MNYRVLIQNRKSVRAFADKQVPFADLQTIQSYYRNAVQRLLPEIQTELYLFGTSTRAALEGAAGYNQFLIGAPQYLVLLSEKAPLATENAGYIMEDLILKLTDMNLDSCWLTFTDSEAVKEALGLETDLEVAAIAAFGYGIKTVRRPRLNIRSMSNIDIRAKQHYVEPKRTIRDMAFIGSWGSRDDLGDYVGFFDDMLWEALYAASLSPSYLNRQAYGFVLHDHGVSLVRRPDDYTTEIDGRLSLGIVLHHFTNVAAEWVNAVQWKFGPDSANLNLPDGHELIATCAL